MTKPYKLKNHNLQTYTERVQKGPCFICEMRAGNNPHHIVYQDDFAIAFLNKYPPLYGYVIVAPCKHKEHVTSDFTRNEYLKLQGLIYEIAEAVKSVVPTERTYLLSLGSQQGNAHVHWHIAPLPPGVPYDQQQCEAISTENGILDIPETDLSTLAQQIQEAMRGTRCP